MSEREDDALLRLVTSLLNSGYRFVTPTPATHDRVNARPDNAVAHTAEGVFGWSRPFVRAVLAPDIFSLAEAAGALVPEGALWRSRFRLSTLDGLGLLHSAYPTTSPGAVFFGPDTYRFVRALRQFLATRPPRRARVVDIGCGTGAAAIFIARAWPDAEVVMSDVNSEALRLARINAKICGVPSIQSVCSDILKDLPGQFDVITANPPYMVDPAKRSYRDGGGALGEAISLRIVAEAIERLAPGGELLLYTGAAIVNGANPFVQQAGAILDAAGLAWHADEIDPDVFGEELQAGAMASADRIAALWLHAIQPASEKLHA